jgi:DNA repair exonuclease SbcCD ATPase subunit
MVKAGLVTDVSAEVGGVERWNAEAKRNEAASLVFYGLAIVDKGACDVCKLKHNESCDPEPDGQADKTKEGEGMAEDAKTSETEKKIADLESEKAGVIAELAASKEKFQVDEKARTDRVAELEKLLSERDARVKELEKMASPPKTLTGDTAGASDGRELAAPPMRIVYRNGQIVQA